MTRRALLAIGITGVVLLTVWVGLAVSWRWVPLPPGVFCLYLFFTAEGSSDVSSPRS